LLLRTTPSVPVFLVAQGGLTFCQKVLAQLEYTKVFEFL